MAWTEYAFEDDVSACSMAGLDLVRPGHEPDALSQHGVGLFVHAPRDVGGIVRAFGVPSQKEHGRDHVELQPQLGGQLRTQRQQVARHAHAHELAAVLLLVALEAGDEVRSDGACPLRIGTAALERDVVDLEIDAVAAIVDGAADLDLGLPVRGQELAGQTGIQGLTAAESVG
jgi:hypothetical protein